MFSVELNFKNKYKGSGLLCELCVLEESGQQHQLECAVLAKFITEIADSKVEYADIFGSVTDQLSAVKLFGKISTQRKHLLETLPIR